MQILVKQIDTLKSKTHKNKTLVEYIVYLILGNTPIEAYTEIGANMLNQRLKTLLSLNDTKNITITQDYNN
jgi:hypothetical protein